MMAAVDFPDKGRVKGSWYAAVPPLVRHYTGLTPMDYFGRTMVGNLPDNVTVGVVRRPYFHEIHKLISIVKMILLF